MELAQQDHEVVRRALMVYLNVVGASDPKWASRAERLLVTLDYVDGRRRNDAPGMPAWAALDDR